MDSYHTEVRVCVCVYRGARGRRGTVTHNPKGNAKMKTREQKPTLCNINCQQLSSATVCIIWFILPRAYSTVIIPILLIEKLRSERLSVIVSGRAGTDTQKVRTLSLQHL